MCFSFNIIFGLEYSNFVVQLCVHVYGCKIMDVIGIKDSFGIIRRVSCDMLNKLQKRGHKLESFWVAFVSIFDDIPFLALICKEPMFETCFQEEENAVISVCMCKS